MTDLAYMVREDWGQHGTAMVRQSAVIREWLGPSPYLFFVTDPKASTDRNVEREVMDFIAPSPHDRKVFATAELARLHREDMAIDHAVTILQPRHNASRQAFVDAVLAGSIVKAFVVIWEPRDMLRVWLDGHAALDLNNGLAANKPHPLLLEAARLIKREDYNGLSSGHGKEAVVQLARALEAEGHPIDVQAWLRAYFAVGGSFDHAESIAKLLKEMQAGVRHRVKRRFVESIADVLRNP